MKIELQRDCDDNYLDLLIIRWVSPSYGLSAVRSMLFWTDYGGNCFI